MELRTLIFEEPGTQNTDATLAIAHERALALGIEQVVVASTHGHTARLAHERFAADGIDVVAVAICHCYGDKGWTMTDEERAAVEALGVPVHTGIHALMPTVGLGFAQKHGGFTPEMIVRDTLYAFCQGMKVAVECAIMAVDAGLIDAEREIIAIAGTDEGADTAIVCKPACSLRFHDLSIREILAKPRVG
jgi:hypothetical protein